MDKKAFALTETLVVVVFLVSIFTFIYISIIPLIGKYENVTNSNGDIDIIYKLYNIRKILLSGTYRSSLTGGQVSAITCEDFYVQNGDDYRVLCNELMKQLDLRYDNTDNYVLVYASGLTNTNLDAITTINSEIGEFATLHREKITDRVLFLLDTNKHTVGYLYYDDDFVDENSVEGNS